MILMRAFFVCLGASIIGTVHSLWRLIAQKAQWHFRYFTHHQGHFLTSKWKSLKWTFQCFNRNQIFAKTVMLNYHTSPKSILNLSPPRGTRPTYNRSDLSRLPRNVNKSKGYKSAKQNPHRNFGIERYTERHVA